MLSRRVVTLRMSVLPHVTLGGRKFSEKRAGPIPLPRDDQEEFERLQKIANSQAAIDEYNQKLENNPLRESVHSASPKQEIGGFSPEYSRTIPEFEGDVNPITGEVGGPKQDPLRHGDYSFNGRVTDF
ncbi:HBR386Wp [Eremothecium sinecaudum]|uniref:Succinate dehydrogenase assembly factor 4, mitochondrial n=1 Tax=Eremothecium sinecaudum TaxID=45286 RepID=A0A109UXT6_9SACH|nr:HBR386Wp [Eremothecium sinecaudum]AMD19287.1 HBR386Wp [Eremothecium sinecaudum]